MHEIYQSCYIRFDFPQPWKTFIFVSIKFGFDLIHSCVLFCEMCLSLNESTFDDVAFASFPVKFASMSRSSFHYFATIQSSHFHAFFFSLLYSYSTQKCGQFWADWCGIASIIHIELIQSNVFNGLPNYVPTDGNKRRATRHTIIPQCLNKLPPQQYLGRPYEIFMDHFRKQSSTNNFHPRLFLIDRIESVYCC